MTGFYKDTMPEYQFETLAVHAGHGSERPRPVATPIYTSASHVHATVESLDAVFDGSVPGHYYSRNGNPTTEAFEQAVAVLEGASGAVAFASGMSALHGALMAAGVRSGDTVLAARDLYGVTIRLLEDIVDLSGARTVFVDTTNTEAVREALRSHRARVLLFETISNPLLRLADLPNLCSIAKETRTTVVVDSTFTSPWLARPLEMGADMVMHSATKYLGGHGDAIGGIVATKASRLEALKKANVVAGSVLGPFEAALLARGIQTLPLRMQRQCENAAALAAWLEEQVEVSRVYYPGLPSHPQHTLAQSLYGHRGYGGMVSFELRDGNLEQASRFINALRVFLNAPSLGDVQSLAMSPAIASHRAVPPEQRAALGIADSLVRLSVGIENLEDLREDLSNGLQATHA